MGFFVVYIAWCVSNHLVKDATQKMCVAAFTMKSSVASHPKNLDSTKSVTEWNACRASVPLVDRYENEVNPSNVLFNK